MRACEELLSFLACHFAKVSRSMTSACQELSTCLSSLPCMVQFSLCVISSQRASLGEDNISTHFMHDSASNICSTKQAVKQTLSSQNAMMRLGIRLQDLRWYGKIVDIHTETLGYC